MALTDLFKRSQSSGNMVSLSNSIARANKRLQATNLYADKVGRPKTGEQSSKLPNQQSETDIADNPNANYLAEFRETTEVLKKMQYNPTIASALDLRQSTIEQLDFDIDYPDEASEQTIELYKKQFRLFENRHLTGLISESIKFGMNPIELIWQKIDGKTLLVTAQGLDYELYGFNNKGESIYLAQPNQPLNPLNFFIPVNRPTKYNRYGKSLLISIFKYWYYKENIDKWWVRYCELYGMPLTYAVPKGLDNLDTKEQEEVVANIVANLDNIYQNGKGVISDNVTIETLQNGNSASQTAYQPYVEYIDKAMYRALLYSDGITQATPGRLGNSDEQQKVLNIVMKSDRKFVEEQWNKVLMYIGQVNGVPIEQIPRVSLLESDDVNTEKLKAETDQILSTMIELDETYFINRYAQLNRDNVKGIKQANEAKVSPQAKLSGFMSSAIDAARLEATTSQVHENEQQLNDFLTDFKADVLSDNTSELTEQLKDVIKSYDNPKQLRKDIAKIYDKLDSSNIEDIISKMLVATDIYGQDTINTESK